MAEERTGVNLELLAMPFAAEDVEWRVMRSGTGQQGVWALVLCYMTARAVQDRLDEVVGPEDWQVQFVDCRGGLECGIGIRVARRNGESEWVWKWDGTGHMAVSEGMDATDSGKADFSMALKRAAVQWGIGRYLYRLEETFADITSGGAEYGKTKDGTTFRWNPPTLPSWALPGGSGKPPAGSTKPQSRAQPARSEPSELPQGSTTTPVPPEAPQATPSANGDDAWQDQPVGCGKHKDRTWREMLDSNVSYVEWVVGQGDSMKRVDKPLRDKLTVAIGQELKLDQPNDDLPFD